MSDDIVQVDVRRVLEEAAALNKATEWSGRYVEVPAVDVHESLTNAAIERVAAVFRKLPEHYSSELAVATDAVVKGAVDARVTDTVDEEEG